MEEEPASPDESLHAFKPFVAYKRAAQGDVEAMRSLRDAFERSGRQNGDPFDLIEALVFARLVAAHGSVEDEGRLVTLLAVAAERCGQLGLLEANTLRGEGLARASVLVESCPDDLRPDNLDVQFDRAVEESTPDAVVMSRAFRAAILDAATQ